MNIHPIKILLIEDDPGDIDLIKEILYELKRKVSLQISKRLANGMTQLAQEKFDVVLLDLSLPDSHGLDTFKKLYHYAPDVPIVVLSGNIDEDIALKTVQMGGQDYLLKGCFDGHLLLRCLCYAVERHHLQNSAQQAQKLANVNAELEKTNQKLRHEINQRQKIEQKLEQNLEELKRKNAQLDKFAYVASHDIKSPLLGIRNLATWVLEDTKDIIPEESIGYLNRLCKLISRLENLLNSLLAYSRVGHISDLEPSYVDSYLLIKDTCDLLSIPKSFLVEIVPPMPQLYAPQGPLSHVFLNLIGNAIKHHEGSKGKIQVLAKELQNFYEFTVIDDGPGIAPQFHQKVFEAFQTLKPRDEIEGSGMGLAYIKEIVKVCGGQLGIRSEAGQGAAFWFTWPKKWKRSL